MFHKNFLHRDIKRARKNFYHHQGRAYALPKRDFIAKDFIRNFQPMGMMVHFKVANEITRISYNNHQSTMRNQHFRVGLSEGIKKKTCSIWTSHQTYVTYVFLRLYIHLNIINIIIFNNKDIVV